jgi:hypothetical protein
MLSLAKLVELLFASPEVSFLVNRDRNACSPVDVPPQETITIKRTIEKIVTLFFIFFYNYQFDLHQFYLFGNTPTSNFLEVHLI